MGLGILSVHCIELELETKRLVTLNVAGFPLMKSWHVAHLSNKTLSSAAEAFKQFMIAHSQDGC